MPEAACFPMRRPVNPKPPAPGRRSLLGPDENDEDGPAGAAGRRGSASLARADRGRE